MGAGVPTHSRFALGSHFEHLVLSYDHGDPNDWHGASGTGNSAANHVWGGSRGDTLDGAAGNDTIEGDNGWDEISGGIGNDHLLGGTGQDTLSGGFGADTLEGGLDADAMDGGDGADLLRGERGAETLAGGAGAYSLDGGDVADTLDGGADADTLQGGASDDRVAGGAGADQLSGGAGADVFAFAAFDGGEGEPARDHVLDFIRGEDVLDLSAIDADPAAAGDQALVVSNGAAASAVWQKVTTDGVLLVSADITGDAEADMQIAISFADGLLSTELVPTAFIL